MIGFWTGVDQSIERFFGADDVLKGHKNSQEGRNDRVVGKGQFCVEAKSYFKTA